MMNANCPPAVSADDLVAAPGATSTNASPRWAEPFAAPYRLIRALTVLLAAATVAVVVLGYWNLDLARNATALVYVVDPTGRSTAVTDRATNSAPSAIEAEHVARTFVALMFGWNSSTVLEDLTALVNLCSPELAARYRQDLAKVSFVDTIRSRQIRSEVEVHAVDIAHHDAAGRYYRVRVRGEALFFPISRYEGSAPLDRRAFDVILSLLTVPRSPEHRPNGLEVVRLEQGEGQYSE